MVLSIASLRRAEDQLHIDMDSMVDIFLFGCDKILNTYIQFLFLSAVIFDFSCTYFKSMKRKGKKYS